MLDSTIAELSAALAAGTLSSVELTSAVLDRIDAENARLNAFLTVEREAALTQAQAADERRAAGDTSPLLRNPVPHNDIPMTAGVRTTCASRMLANFISPYDAHVVSQLATAGMVMVG